MNQKKLHPSVLKFKEFVKNNPKLIQEVRQEKATWQELYEDWYLLGEDDERWKTVENNKKNDSELAGSKKNAVESNDEKKSDWMSAITGMM
jgi:outer membrane protein assembly factor BamD (BamD/ComL family)